jgi:hypothetical protein
MPQLPLPVVLQELAETFAREIVSAIRAASVADIIGETSATATLKRRPGRPPKNGSSTVAPTPTGRHRRSADELEKHVSLIAKYVASHPGSNAETVRKELGITRNQWARPVAMALKSKAIKKKGEKRATSYWAG